MPLVFTILAYVIGGIVSYLLGSVNFAIIITRLFGKGDIRDFGSGNAGMTNVLRTVGKTAAGITLAGDFLKGYIAVFLMRMFLLLVGVNESFLGDYIAIYCAIVGHVFPVFYGFRGGKGILVAFGAIMVLSPVSGLICLGVFLVTVSISKYISLGSIIAGIACPIAILLCSTVFFPNTGGGYIEGILAIPMSALIIFLHRENIKRLLSHTENKLSFKKNV